MPERGGAALGDGAVREGGEGAVSLGDGTALALGRKLPLSRDPVDSKRRDAPLGGAHRVADPARVFVGGWQKQGRLWTPVGLLHCENPDMRAASEARDGREMRGTRLEPSGAVRLAWSERRYAPAGQSWNSRCKVG